MTVTHARLREVLSYDSETGEFVWIKPPNVHPRMLGKTAGCGSTGYTLIRIDTKKYKAHRLAWLYVYGELPTMPIDHRDGDPFNNAIRNLRLATHSQNCANARQRRGKVLPKGVRMTPSGRFQARIRFEHKPIALGAFNTPEEASAAYARAAAELFGPFARAA